MVTTVNDNSPQAINTSLFSIQKQIDDLQKQLNAAKEQLGIDIDNVIDDEKTGEDTTWSSEKIDGELDKKASVDQALMKSGGAMTGNISFKGTKATTEIIKFIDNTVDTYGNGIEIGGGGPTVIGGGESARAWVSQKLTGDGAEIMDITNDQAVRIISNLQSGNVSDGRVFTFGTDGSLRIPTTNTEDGDDRALVLKDGGVICELRKSGGWANGLTYYAKNGTLKGGFGAYGSSSNGDATLQYYYWGSYGDKNGFWLYPNIYSSTVASQQHGGFRQSWNGTMSPLGAISWTYNVSGRPYISVANQTSGYSCSVKSAFRVFNTLYLTLTLVVNTTISAGSYGTQDIKVTCPSTISMDSITFQEIGYYGNNAVIASYQGDYIGDNTAQSRGIRVRWQTHGVNFTAGSTTGVTLRIPLTNYPLNG